MSLAFAAMLVVFAAAFLARAPIGHAMLADRKSVV